jgi:hypothetical protein
MSKENLNRYERNERALAAQMFNTFNKTIKAYKFTSGKICYDGYYITDDNDKEVIFEIKVRNTQIDQYPDYILQADKANNLSKWHNKGHQVKYINFFKNENGQYDAIIFDLSYRIELWRKQGYENVIEYKWMNNATYISNQKIQKPVIMIKYDPTIDMKIMNTSWCLN